MKTMARKALVVTALAVTTVFVTSGVASAAEVGDFVGATAQDTTEGAAYALARDAARAQCPHPNDVSLSSRSTELDPNGHTWTARVVLRCN
jgi:hypothetical protein